VTFVFTDPNAAVALQDGDADLLTGVGDIDVAVRGQPRLGGQLHPVER
jgi:hypothetical protein